MDKKEVKMLRLEAVEKTKLIIIKRIEEVLIRDQIGIKECCRLNLEQLKKEIAKLKS